MSTNRQYELVYVLTPESTDEQIAELHTQIEQIVQRYSGTLDKTENWGRRKLAYEIGHKSEGTYHLVLFTAAPATLAEVSRVLKITDGVMRHLAVRRVKGGQTKAPAPIVAVSVPADDSDTGAE
jgi:small subunit ribosomal protein S6